LARPEIVRVSVSTNGLGFLSEPALLAEFSRRKVCVSLQFDGFNERADEIFRGRPLLAEKLRVLKLLEAADIATSLTMTVARGVNDDQFRPVLDHFFSHEHVISMMIQPIAFAGRAAGLKGKAGRISIPDVIAALGSAGHPAVSAADFAPLPCSHPLCFSLAFYLVAQGGHSVALKKLFGAAELMDVVCNRLFYGLNPEEHANIKDMVYRLWSGPSACTPDSKAVICTVQELLRKISAGSFDPKHVFTLAERRVKSIFIHAFQDAETFDLARVRRCCNAYPQPDGRIIPCCVRNNLGGRPT
jgi:7,8-dihydro-6-hydroxymethylpterin dimethyltransferase